MNAPLILFLALFVSCFQTILAVKLSPQQLILLFNHRGLNPCALGAALLDPCPPLDVSILQPNRDGVSPSLPSVSVSDCTCNLAFYNIWSACWAYAGDEPPTFSRWKDFCSQSAISVTKGPLPQRVTQQAGDIPQWATIDVTSASTFDLPRAIAVATSISRSWTALQIAVPFIAGFTILALVVLIYLWYERAQTRKKPKSLREWSKQLPHVRGPRKLFGLLPDISVVRHFDRLDKWHIDQDTDFEPLRPSGSRRSGSLSTPPSATRPKASPQTWRFGLNDLRLAPPWRAGPVAVVPAVPKTEFHIDESQMSTHPESTGSSRSGTPVQEELRHSDNLGSASWFRSFPWRSRVTASAPPIEDSELSFYAGPSRRTSIVSSIGRTEAARAWQDMEEAQHGRTGFHVRSFPPSPLATPQSLPLARLGTPPHTARSPPPLPHGAGEHPQASAPPESPFSPSIYTQMTNEVVSPRPQIKRSGSGASQFYRDGYPRRPPGVVPAR